MMANWVMQSLQQRGGIMMFRKTMFGALILSAAALALHRSTQRDGAFVRIREYDVQNAADPSACRGDQFSSNRCAPHRSPVEIY